jgi:F0F1-type ATP synthase membrane subunit b/b'
MTISRSTSTNLSAKFHFLFCATTTVLPSVASASSGNGEPSIGDLTFYWTNFVLYLGLITYILRKPLAKGWASRVARIKQTVAQSGDDVGAAERELNAIEALIKALPLEQDKIKQQLVEQANAEADDVIKQAQQRATRIKDQARELLKGETRSAQVSFKQSLVSRALQLAKERFASGDFAGRDNDYQAAAVTRAKSLVQN